MGRPLMTSQAWKGLNDFVVTLYLLLETVTIKNMIKILLYRVTSFMDDPKEKQVMIIMIISNRVT